MKSSEYAELVGVILTKGSHRPITQNVSAS